METRDMSKGPCSACGNMHHSDPRECLDSDENFQKAQAKTKADVFEPILDIFAQVPHYATLEEAVAVYHQGNLHLQRVLCPATSDKVDEIIRNRDVIELVRLAQWMRKYRLTFGQDGLEVAIAIDRPELFTHHFSNNALLSMVINNAFHTMVVICKKEYALRYALKHAKAMGCVDALQVLHKEKLIDAKDLLPWPPGEEPPGDLLVETLRVTMDHIGDLLVQGDVAGARSMLGRIPPATLRKGALASIPPYRADVISLLLHDHHVVDPSVYVMSLRMMQNRYYYSRKLKVVRTPVAYPLLEAWGPDVPWTLAPPDAFDQQYLTLFPHKGDRNPTEPCIVSRREFEMNMEAFIGFPAEKLQLQDHSMVLAGGCVVACLLPDAEHLPPSATLEQRVEYFRSPHYANSDVDLFTIGNAASNKKDDASLLEVRQLKHFIECVKSALGGAEILVLIRSRTVTLIPPYPHRRIQVHIGPWPNLRDVLANTDVDCTGVGCDLDGKVQFTLRSHFAWTRRCNVPDGDLAYRIRGCPTYEKRLLKYARRGFSIVDVGVPVGRRSAVDDVVTTMENPHGELNGLKGLLWLRTIELNPKLITRRRCGEVSDLPFGPSVTFQDIVTKVTSTEYTPSDNYGGHETGYLPCVWWCRDSVVISKEHYQYNTQTWHGAVEFFVYESYVDPESHRYNVPSWYSGIPTLGPVYGKRGKGAAGDHDEDVDEAEEDEDEFEEYDGCNTRHDEADDD